MFLTIILLFMYVLGIIQGLTRPLVIGHRGTAYLPELTLATQSMAHAYGADVIEIDVCLSRDDQLIVIHGKSSTYQNVNIVLFST
jgi:glycerophosphoryl diester phosphodiesterase